VFAESNSNAYVELNNTTFSKSQNYGIYFEQYSATTYCKVTTADASTVTFDQCAIANVGLRIVGSAATPYTTLAAAIAAIGQ
jgi:hypothetical protein